MVCASSTGSSSHRQRCPGGWWPGSEGRQAMRRPSSNSTTWFTRMLPWVSVMVNTSPVAPRARWTSSGHETHRGCEAGYLRVEQVRGEDVLDPPSPGGQDLLVVVAQVAVERGAVGRDAVGPPVLGELFTVALDQGVHP